MTGFLNIPEPFSSTNAATKNYVDTKVATVGGTQTQIATASGFKVQTATDKVTVKNGADTSVLDISHANNRLHYQQLTGNQQRFSIPDTSAVEYQFQFKAAGSTRPEFQIADKGTEGTQTLRLATFNGSGGNETFIQMKPNLNTIELSAPTSYTGTYNASLYTNDQQLVPKKYVDNAVV